jgi:hypothetical protein
MTAVATLAALAAPVAARSPHTVDPHSVTPPLNPDLAPWACWETGNGVICEGSAEGSYANEDFGLRCGDQVILVSGAFSDRATRWHTSDGRATATFGNLAFTETWSFSPDGSSPSVHLQGRSIRHYTYLVPGDPTQRQLVETGSLVASTPDGGLVFRDAGQIVFDIGAGNDFQNPIQIRGPHDTWTDFEAVLARVCSILAG